MDAVYPNGMETQNQVKRTLAKAEAIAHIRSVLDGEKNINRTQLADRLCQRHGFIDALGRPQRSTCLRALRDLEERGHIRLPAPVVEHGPAQPRRLAEPVAEPRGVPAKAGEVVALELILVGSEEHIRTWNEMMIREHPRGAGPLVGRQLRYLVSSEHGWLGAMGFGAPALHLKDRDRWIGWDYEMRRAQLHRVVGLSRFLIRPQVCCRNLASRLLGLVLRRLPGDFEKRYGFRPWLVESFVDTSHFAGTCFKAANWVWVGCSQGRGRQGPRQERPETIKDIYLYALDKDFRRKLGVPEEKAPCAVEVADGLGADQWAEKEFGGAPLGDSRLSRRLVACAGSKAEQPDRAFTGVAKGNWPAVKGYYRLIDQPDESAVNMENILLPHRERTIQRMRGQKTVLCIQDGSDLNYSNLDSCAGLGIIGSNQTGAKSRGLHLHSTLAVTTDGLPLGLLKAQCHAPGSRSEAETRPTCSLPIEEKETFRWVLGLRDCMDIAGQMADTKIISVMDREADFFELFDERRRDPCVELLVRARYNRCTTGDLKLFDAVRESEVRGQFRIHVKRQSARSKKSKQNARAKRDERMAEVSVRYLPIELSPPVHHKDKAPIPMQVIHVVEDNPPPDVERIEWFLLTTLAVQCVADAEQCLRWYCLRWRIEDWHRVLKSGCCIEAAAHKTAERLKRSIAINLVIAWRIMLMTLLGRETPELPAEVLFSDLEVEVLRAYAKKNTSSCRNNWETRCAW
jgi:hypothetical protein